MTSAVPLPVLMPEIPTQRWSCHSCGACCRDLVVHISREERARLDEQEWGRAIGAPPYVRAGRSWALNKWDDGACVFLSEDNRCRIHEKLGADAKPFACRLFPFSLRGVDRGLQASLRFDCPSVVGSTGELLPAHGAWVSRAAAELGCGVEPAERSSALQRGLRATRAETEAVDRWMIRWLRGDDRGIFERILGAARLTSILHGASLKKVRGDRFVELADLLFGAVHSECADPADPPTVRQAGLLRQSVFSHCESLTLAELRRGAAFRVLQRFRQLGKARAFARGRGAAPAVPGLDGTASFEQIERVAPPRDDCQRIDELVGRYAVVRITERAVYGGGYYGWSLVNGYAALWLSLVVVGWVARYAAAIRGRDALAFDDVAKAVALVDRAATRSPALGTFAERVRVAYLVRDDGIARLLHRFRFTAIEGDMP